MLVDIGKQAIEKCRCDRFKAIIFKSKILIRSLFLTTFVELLSVQNNLIQWNLSGLEIGLKFLGNLIIVVDFKSAKNDYNLLLYTIFLGWRS